MLKRTISFILVLVLTLSLFSVASASFSAVDSVAEVKPESVDVTNGKFPIFEGYHTVVYKDLVYMQSAYIKAWGKGEYLTEYWGNEWPGVKMQYAYTDENRNKFYVAYVPDNYTSYLINNGSAKTEIYQLQDNVGVFVDGVTMPNGYWTLDTWQPEFYIYGEENTTPSEPTTSPEASTNTPEIPTSTDPISPTETSATEPDEETTTPTKTEPSVPTETIASDPTEEPTTPIETETTEKLSATIYTFKYSDHKYKLFADVNGGIGTYEYQFAVNGTICQSFSTKDYVIYVFPSDGSYTIEATIKDSAGETISTTASLHIESTPTSEPVTNPTETEPLNPDALETSKTEGADKSQGLGYIFGYLGDVDLTDTVNIKDATTIQKHVASLLSLKDSNITLADVDFSGSVNIKDATTIQKWIAGITVDAPVYHLLYAPFNTSKHIHAYKFSGVAPTCTEKGYVEYSCACGESYKDNWADAKHTYTAKTTPPTCTENGYTVFTCKCGDSYTGNIVPSTGHSYTSKVVSPTCKDKGYTLHKCFCGDEYKDNWVNVTSTHSYKDGVCTICGADEPHTHSYAAKVIAPTCKDKGYTLHKCSCGDEYKDNWVNITSTHSYKNGVCTICGADEPHKHSYTSTVVAPTCMVKGYTIYTCSCGDRYLDDWTESYGSHDFSDYICSICETTPFNYYASWIMENSTAYDDYYEYYFNSIYQVDSMKNYDVYVSYYPDYPTCITLGLFDYQYNEQTLIFLYDNDAEASCIFGDINNTYLIHSFIDITSFTDSTQIYPTSNSKYDNSNVISFAQQSIRLTIAAHGYVMEEEVTGVSLEDLGFYSFLSSNNNPETNPISNCTDFPLHLYSNDGKVYLGKLTTNSYDSNSIWNPYGTYGSKYSTNSIWNEYGTYGSPYSTNSAFNPYTTTPPIIVTNSGKTIGYLTANEYLTNGFSVTELELLLKQIGQ